MGILCLLVNKIKNRKHVYIQNILHAMRGTESDVAPTIERSTVRDTEREVGMQEMTPQIAEPLEGFVVKY